MKNTSQIPDLSSFYRLPFESDSFELTEKTLNLHSEFRSPDRFFQVKTRNIHFGNEILTLGVTIKNEPEQLIFIKIARRELLICCNVDTNPTYLSRYSYFGLWSLLGYRSSRCFREFYWPDFFDSVTGKSPFLKIFNDRCGLDIELKSKYPHFYKPGDQLIEWYELKGISKKSTTSPPTLDLPSSREISIGFFLADTCLKSIHSNHYSFLVAFLGITTKDRQKVKSFTSFLLTEDDLPTSNFPLSPRQQELVKISFEMQKLAPVGPSYWRAPFFPDTAEKENGARLLTLWHQAKDVLLSQPYVSYYQTHGLTYLKGKPRRSWIHPFQIQKEQPHLIIKKNDKGKYFQFELKFRVSRKTLSPEKTPNCFFIKSTSEPEKLYLLERFIDFQLVLFFSHFNYKLAVMKSHIQDEFKEFEDQLVKYFEIIEG